MPTDARAQQIRNRYLTDAVQTATPAARLVMLYDALEMDLAYADKAFDAGTDLKEVNDRLIHAQEIIMTLRDTVDPGGWDGAPRLIGLYNYLNVELLGANMDKDRERAAGVADHVRQLGAAWRQAAATVDSEVAA